MTFIFIFFVLLIIVFGVKKGSNIFIGLFLAYWILKITIALLPVLIVLGIAGYFYLRKRVKVFRSFNTNFNGNQNSYGNGSGNPFESFNNSGRIKEYYKELEVDESISDEDLKKNQKKLIRIYHPDIHHDKSEEERKKYEEKLKKINEAYENIKKSRGL